MMSKMHGINVRELSVFWIMPVAADEFVSRQSENNGTIAGLVVVGVVSWRVVAVVVAFSKGSQ